MATRPPRDILRLLDAAIFNLIIGNADAHAKNFSLLHKDGAIVLAPLYDLLSTVLYPELSPKLAMKIGGKHLLKELDSPLGQVRRQDCGALVLRSCGPIRAIVWRLSLPRWAVNLLAPTWAVQMDLSPSLHA